MKHSTLLALALCAFLIVSFSSIAEEIVPGLEGIPEVVAEVEGKPIHRLELMRELVGASGTKALERLVHRILVEQCAVERHVVVTDQDIELQYKADQRDFANDLSRVDRDAKTAISMEGIVRAKFGVDVAEYKNTIVRQRLLARRCLGTDINPSDEELHKFFEKYPDLFQGQVKYRAAHILISPLDPRDISSYGGQFKTSFGQMLSFEQMRESRKRAYLDNNVEFKDSPTEEIDEGWRVAKIQAEQLCQELQAYPQRWNDYVKRFSRDPMDQAPMQPANSRVPVLTARARANLLPGEVGWFNKFGPMVGDFYAGAKAIRVGQIGGPVRTRFGWHIVKMMDVRFPPVVSFSDPAVKEKVRRMYEENEIQLRSESWLAELAARADLQSEKATLWPPKAEPERPAQIGIEVVAAMDREKPEPDPIVGRVNGVPIKRSEIWRDLLRSEGEDALRRLVNREVVLTILKNKGVPYMEWFCSSANHRSPNAPPSQPIRITESMMQAEMLEDRSEFDFEINLPHITFSEYAQHYPGKTEADYRRAFAASKEYANSTFIDYIFRRSGQTEAEYRRALEASLVLRTAIRQKVVPADERAFERTLKFEFAMARDQYSQSPWYEISHILIVPSGGMLRADENAQLAARTAADTIYRQYLEKPDSWAQLVEQFSDDTPENKAQHGKLSGCYSDRAPSDVPESLQFFNEITTERLEAGQVTPPQRSARGYHIVRLDRKHPATQADFDGADGKRKQVEMDYINEQAKYYADIWVRALNSRAVVKHYLYKPTLQYEQDDGISDVFPLPKD